MGTNTPHEETVAEAEAALQGTVRAYDEASASKDVGRVALAILDVGIAHLRVSLAEQRRDGRAESTSDDAGDVFEAAFGAAADVARVSARWAAEYTTKRLGQGDPHGVGEDLDSGPIADVLDKLRAEFVRVHAASHRRSMS